MSSANKPASPPSTPRAAWPPVLVFTILASLPFLVPGAGFLALICFTPLFLLDEWFLRNEKRRGWPWFFLAFLLFNVAATFWVWNVSKPGCVAALLANTLQMSALFGAFRLLRRLTAARCGFSGVERNGREPLPYLFFIALWIAWEFLYCRVELSWPWLVLGNALATVPRFAQGYALTGVSGGTLWILVCSWLAFLCLRAVTRGNRGEVRRYARYASLAITVPAAASLVSYYSWREAGDPVEVLALQPNVDPFLKFGEIPQEELDESILRLVDSRITPRTRYAITPETFTYDIDIRRPEASKSYRRFSDYTLEHPGLNFILGALTHEFYPGTACPGETARRLGNRWYDVYNTAMVTGVGTPFDWYHKSKLVPGVEVFPRELSLFKPIVEKFGGSGDSYGTMKRMKALQGSDGHRFGVMICYESVYGDFSSRAVREGADLLAVITNDGWWGDTPGYRQHFRLASLRAIENRRDVVQAANTGISGFINQRGDVILRTGWWEQTALLGVMHANTERTFFSRYGDWIGRGMCMAAPLILLLLLSLWYADRRSGRDKSGKGSA